MSKTSTITIRVHSSIKDAAVARAQALGINLSTLIEHDLRQFVNGRPVTIDDGSRVPSHTLLDMVAQSDAEFARGEGVAITPNQLDSYFESLDQADG